MVTHNRVRIMRESLRRFDHELDSDSSALGSLWEFVGKECPNRFLILEDQGGSGALGCMEENRDKGAQEEDSRGQRKGQVQVLGCWPNVWRKKGCFTPRATAGGLEDVWGDGVMSLALNRLELLWR